MYNVLLVRLLILKNANIEYLRIEYWGILVHSIPAGYTVRLQSGTQKLYSKDVRILMLRSWSSLVETGFILCETA